ncbi:TatD family hydrolase [Alkalimonas sp. MEB108]|uniref:TatD family hydrolase n=1 Tax=Alkalimonas cellulosilytica TaxID=3058395 RepID=A0ABU7J7Q4_9GAMM|nr:TatD family hydrolase [Alkalimonas sp. MEB108]MEE2002549.1 TatD family hydrolase [Alkalimonas sp. MEB108]
MPLKLFDTHCHLDLPELAGQMEEHWQAAQAAGVAALLIPAVEQAAWQPLLKLRQQQPEWQIALGIHPWWAAQHSLQAVTALETMLREQQDAICAIGEIGLDFALAPDTFSMQQQLFEAQLALAARLNKPVILHHRKSQPHLLAAIKRVNFAEGGILHAFSGSPEQGQAFIERGFKLGIGGTISYERAGKTRRAVQQLPLSAFVLETDAPAMPLAGFQGQINTPAQLAQVFHHFCLLRPESPAQLAEALWHNTQQVLRLVPTSAV